MVGVFLRGLAAGWTAVLLAACVPVADAEPATERRYVFYLHGQIVEDVGPRGVSERYGAVDYPGAVAALQAGGATVLSEARPRGTDPSAYADRIVGEVRALLQSGVPPERITIAGASKGAVIAALVSTRLAEPRVRYVLLANCNPWLIRTYDPRLSGEVLSIYEKSDHIGGSCEELVGHSPGVTRFEEVALDTGLGHGMIYRPMPEWVEPARAWISR